MSPERTRNVSSPEVKKSKQRARSQSPLPTFGTAKKQHQTFETNKNTIPKPKQDLTAINIKNLGIDPVIRPKKRSQSKDIEQIQQWNINNQNYQKVVTKMNDMN